MAQEFYSKTQALHEEFQKRELYYLNTERKLRSDIMSKKELNLPFQEYIQRINQREKESEEAYRSIMKQMEELDKHTDIMSLKLEKLGIFRNSLTSLALPNWPSSIESNLQTYGTTQNFNRMFGSLEPNAKSMFETNLKSISTQTENTMYCEKCQSLIHTQPEHIENDEIPSFLQSGIIGEPQSIHSKYQESSISNYVHGNLLTSTLRSDDHNKQFILSSGNGVPSTVPTNINNFKEVNSTVPQEIKKKLNTEYIQSDVPLTEGHGSVKKQLVSNKGLTEIMENRILTSTEKLIETQHSQNNNYEPNSQDAEFNIDTFVSKSDAESMNNEFDFLESDTRTVSPRTKDQNVLKSDKSESNDADVSLTKEVNSAVEPPSEAAPLPEAKDVFNSITKQEFNDKSETTGSVSAPHSPAVSDSDSAYGKGSSLTASAAYQALLGKSVIPKDTKVDNSSSESADEAETALASVVQRSHIKSKSSKASQMIEVKRKSSSEVFESKPVVKGSKLPSTNKPQSKLSKNTRKVLGLDTSSGSEVELAVKPPVKKIEEDSDEFDFYD